MAELQNKQPFVLFDLGATLIYHDGAHVMPQAILAMEQSLQAQGVALDAHDFCGAYARSSAAYYDRRAAELREFTAETVLARVLAGLGFPAVDSEILKTALNTFYGVLQTHWQVEADAAFMLDALRRSGRRLGIVSNACDDTDVQKLVDQAQLRPYFDFVLSSAVVGFRKPHAAMFHEALGWWRTVPEQVLMVGDTLSADVLGARRMGITSVWVTRRADTEENRRLADSIRPDYTIPNLAAFVELLECG